MKRLLVFLLAVSLISFTACASSAPSAPLLDFEAQIQIDGTEVYEGLFDLQAEITSTMQGAVVIRVTTPDELWGLTYKWSDGFELIYEGIHAKTQKDYMPKEGFAQAIFNVLCALSREESCDSFSQGVAVFTGECPSGSYKVTTDSAGYIQNISVERLKLSVDFEYE